MTLDYAPDSAEPPEGTGTDWLGELIAAGRDSRREFSARERAAIAVLPRLAEELTPEQRARAWRIAAVCTLASVAGGVAGYGIGYFAFETVGRPIVELYGAVDAYESFRDAYNEWGYFDNDAHVRLLTTRRSTRSN